MENKYIEFIRELAIKIKWRGKYVWIAMEIAEYLEYDKPSKIVNYFLEVSGLVEDVDYMIISQNDLREFKDRLLALKIDKFRQSPKLILFYESGLVEFLKYRNKLSVEDIENIFIDNYGAKVKDIESEMMIKNFKGYNIYTLTWEGKYCWVATNIAETIGYKDKTKAVSQCIIREEFKRGLDYDVLDASDVRKLIKANGDTSFASGKLITHITIFYKRGLLGFINYAHMPIGKEFRQWLREEVFEELIDMEVGDTIIENKFSIKGDNLSNDDFDNSNISNSKLEMIEILSVVDKILEEQDERKLFYLDSIFKNI